MVRIQDMRYHPGLKTPLAAGCAMGADGHRPWSLCPPAPRRQRCAGAADLSGVCAFCYLGGSCSSIASAQRSRRFWQEVPLDVLQFHGDEGRADFCKPVRAALSKSATSWRAGDDLNALAAQWRMRSGILLDSYKAGVPVAPVKITRLGP